MSLRGLGARVFASFLRYPKFRLLWISNLFFFCGVWTQTLVLGWLAYDYTGSAFLLALFGAIRLAPMMLGPVAGVMSDRFHRPRLLMVAAGWSFLAMAVVAAAVTTGRMSYLGLLLGGLCVGIAHSPSQPARATLVMDLVAPEDLSNANSLNSIVINMTQVLGPAAGGVLIGAVGAGGALWISSFWFLVSCLTLWPLRRHGRRASVAARESFGASLLQGLRAARHSRLVAAALAVTLGANLTLWPIYQSFMPVFATRLELDATGLGWLMACGGLGGLAGSLVIAGLGDFRRKGALFVFGTMTWASFWMLFSLSRFAPLSFVLLIGVGLASAAFGILQTTLLLMMSRQELRGRMLGLQELAIGAQPLATVLLGAGAEYLGVPAMTFVGALSLLIFLVLLARFVPDLVRYTGGTAMAGGHPSESSLRS